jgi:hypothetical protein
MKYRQGKERNIAFTPIRINYITRRSILSKLTAFPISIVLGNMAFSHQFVNSKVRSAIEVPAKNQRALALRRQTQL